MIDVGSSSMRGILFDEHGTGLGQKQIKYHQSYGEDGICVEQDPLEYKEALYEILEWTGETTGKLSVELTGIGLTSQRSSCICLDWAGNPIGNAICWQDKRTVPICGELDKYGAMVTEKSGAWINPVFFAPKLTWIRENRKEVYDRTWKFMNIADYMVYLLTGNTRTDDTYASRTHMMNLKTKNWDPALLEVFQAEPEKLCDIYPVGSVMGGIREELAALTGIPAHLPVWSAGGDQQCALVGQGICEQGSASITLGTGEFIGMQLHTLPEHRSDEVIYNASSISGEYIVEYNVVTCCSALDWLLREIYPNLKYEKIGKELKKSRPGAAGCIHLPFFQGRVTPDHNSASKAVFAGISLSTKKADLLRAFIESIGYETRYGIEAMPECPKEIVVNGGLTGTPEICQILVDILGRPIYINREADATALGAFLVVKAADGTYPSVKAAYESLRTAADLEKYEPDTGMAKMYAERMEDHLELYRRIYGGYYEGRKKNFG